MLAINLLYEVTRSVDIHSDDYSIGNTDAKYHLIDRKAIRVAVSQVNVKSLAAFGQNICKSFASPPAAVSDEWRDPREGEWAHFWFHSGERLFALVEN
jgi:hypothetical protein